MPLFITGLQHCNMALHFSMFHMHRIYPADPTQHAIVTTRMTWTVFKVRESQPKRSFATENKPGGPETNTTALGPCIHINHGISFTGVQASQPFTPQHTGNHPNTMAQRCTRHSRSWNYPPPRMQSRMQNVTTGLFHFRIGNPDVNLHLWLL